MPKLCLSMIVKNETHIIKECFDSLVQYIDYWVIGVDMSMSEKDAYIQENDYFDNE